MFSKIRKISILLRKPAIVADIKVMKGMTIDEIADELSIPWKTAHKRIEKLGIKPLSYKALYDPSVVEAIRIVPGKGRPRKKNNNFSDIIIMNGLTIREIAEKLKIEPKAVTARLLSAGIQPKQKAGRTNIYDPSVVDKIRIVPGKGRPKKQAEAKIPAKILEK